MYHSLVLHHLYKPLDCNSELSNITLQVSPDFKLYIVLEKSWQF